MRLIFLKASIAIVLFGFLVWFLKPELLLEAAGQVDGSRLLLCGAIALVGIGVQWIKWQRLLRDQIPEAKWIEGLYSLLGGTALRLVTPGGVGEVGRGVFLGRNHVSLAVLTAIDKLSSGAITLVLGWLAAWVLWPNIRIYLLFSLVVVGGSAWLGWRWGESSVKLIKAIKAVKSIDRWGTVLGLSLVFNLVYMTQFLCLVTVGMVVDQTLVLAIPVVFALKALLPLGFMDLGVREAAAVVVFSSLGLETQPAFVACVLLFAFNICLPAGLGWIWVGGRTKLKKPYWNLRKVFQ